MKFKVVVSCAVMALFVFSLHAKEQTGQTVDSGSFGVFVNGQRVVTETFNIQQAPTGNTVNSELREEGSKDKPTQSSQMQLSGTGELIRYNWRELSPGKTQLEVIPNDQFLIERVTVNPGEKPAEQPFLLPSSTVVLDNNFFIHRELLAWRYLGQNCKNDAGKVQCPTSPISFGTIVPQDRLSMRVTLEPVGKEKVQVRGTDRELARFNLKFEGGEWAMWLDDQDHYKVVKISIPSEKTEVVRD